MFYWMVCYVERVENFVCLINVNNFLLMDLFKGFLLGWELLLDIIGNCELFEVIYNEYSEKNVVKFLMVDICNLFFILNLF